MCYLPSRCVLCVCQPLSVAQASSSKPQQSGIKQLAADADLPTEAQATKGKQPAKLEAHTQPAARRLRVKGLSHTDTKLKKTAGQDEQAGCSNGPALHTPSAEQQQQRRSTRQHGSTQMLGPPPLGGVHKKLPSQHGVHPLVPAGKSKSKGKRPAETGSEPKAERSKQVSVAPSKGKQAAASKWEAVDLELPSGPFAKGQKAASGKGKLKGPLPHSVSIGKAKGCAGVKKQATAAAQSPAQESKPVLDAKEEPGASTPGCDSTAHAGQLGTDVMECTLGLGKGKRKRTATKPLHMQEEHSKGEQLSGSKHHSLAGKVQEANGRRCAHHVAGFTAKVQALVLVLPAGSPRCLNMPKVAGKGFSEC